MPTASKRWDCSLVKLKSFFLIFQKIHPSQSNQINTTKMSSTRVNTSLSRSKFAAEKPVKKHCGVCQKAGRSESEYTSHFTKSVPGPQGIVTCPTILCNECSYCYERGHFKSACPQLAVKEKMQKRSGYQEKSVTSQKKKSELPIIPVGRGGFSALAASDSDSEEDRTIGKKRTFAKIDPVPVKEAWPALATTAVPVKPEKPSFASVISAPAPVKKEDTSRPNICGFTVLTKGGAKPVAPAPVYYERNEAEKVAYARAKKSWAESDSDDDEDEDW